MLVQRVISYISNRIPSLTGAFSKRVIMLLFWFARHLVVMAATRFVRFTRADKNDRIVVRGGRTVNEPLRPTSRGAANGTDRLQFRHRFGDGHERRYRPERFAAEVLIQPGGDDAIATIRERLHDINNVIRKNCTSSMATTSVVAEI